jgi:biopolymer transport protein ExbD
MPLKPRFHESEDPAPSLTPMIDVVLVLTIFFMCATRFSGDERQFDVELPSVSAAPPVTAVGPDLLEISAEGDVSFGGETMPLGELSSRLAERQAGRPEMNVLIRGDRAVSHGTMAEVYEACRLAGIRHVGISVATRGDTGTAAAAVPRSMR